VVQAVAEGLGAPPAPIPVAAHAIGFAPGSATIDRDITPIAGWARENLADPRVALRITGMTEASPADVERTSGSAALLAADRARAVAAALAVAGVPIDRTIIVNADAAAPRRRQALVTLAFVGEEGRKP
jgi:flagellar motor protein MotB